MAAPLVSYASDPVYGLKPGDHAAGVDADSFKLAKYRTATFKILFGALTGDAVLTVNSGATDGTKTTAETFHYRLADAVQGSATADTFGDRTSVTTLTLTAATYQNKMLLVTISEDDLTADQEWVTLALSSAASVLNAAIEVTLEDPRYSAQDMPTSIS